MSVTLIFVVSDQSRVFSQTVKAMIWDMLSMFVISQHLSPEILSTYYTQAINFA